VPIGFAQDGSYVGLTCAACHASQINHNGTAYLIDGGPALGNAEKLLRNLELSLESTLTNDAKFDRFAKAVLGETADEKSRNTLKNDLATSLSSGGAIY
jgi:hypothetical protein